MGDFAGDKALRSVGKYLKEQEATVSALYTSNVEEYLFMQGEDWARFYSNVAMLPIDSKSTFIRGVLNMRDPRATTRGQDRQPCYAQSKNSWKLSTPGKLQVMTTSSECRINPVL